MGTPQHHIENILKGIFKSQGLEESLGMLKISDRPDLLDEMISALKNIKGVNEIVNYVIIKEEE